MRRTPLSAALVLTAPVLVIACVDPRAPTARGEARPRTMILQPLPLAIRIALSTNRDGNAELYLMNTNGTDQVNVSDRPADDVRPSWSR